MSMLTSRTASLLPLLLVAASASSSVAAPPIDGGLLADVAFGVAIPAGDNNHTRLSDASFRFSVRAGWALQLHERFRIAPEVSVNVVAVNPDRNGVPTTYTRAGMLGGARLIVPLHERVAVFARVGVGFDFATLSVSVPFFGTVRSESTALALEPGLGVDVMIIKHLVVGVSAGVPIAFHNLGGSKFTAVDFDVMLFVGYRMDGPLLTR